MRRSLSLPARVPVSVSPRVSLTYMEIDLQYVVLGIITTYRKGRDLEGRDATIISSHRYKRPSNLTISSMISSKKIPSDTFGIFLGYLDSAPLPLHAVCACEVFADPTGDLRSYGQGALTRAMSSPYAPAPTQ